MSTVPASGGLKGLIVWAGDFLLGNYALVREKGGALAKAGYKYGGSVAFALATTSMVVFMPLLFEIAREGQVRYACALMLLSIVSIPPKRAEQLSTDLIFGYDAPFRCIFSRLSLRRHSIIACL